ncbi:MAG: DNA polymerase Y family protein [Burkholderiaceae bacterium]|nr:DNA polymerase Y family protein [Burkholderiaceae bacterium]
MPDTTQPEVTPPDATLLAWRALQFTPRVALADGAVLMEIAASERLFGGGRALLQQFFEQIPAYSSVRWSYGATSLIAIGRLWQSLQVPLAQSAPPAPRRHSAAGPSAPALIAPRKLTPPAQLPLAALAAARPHLATLERLGCRNWGDLRALPRGGLSRRFGSELLAALDRAWGLAPEVYPWLTLPEHFDEPLELPAQVETAPALLFGARRLLARLHAWLQLRQQGVLALRLGWQVDRRRNVPPEGSLQVRTAEPTLDMAHIERLLAENLAQTLLAAPAHTLRLTTLETTRLDGASASLLIDDARRGDSLHQLVERLGARLGPERVLCAVTHADHRPERMQAWVPVTENPEFIAENHHLTLEFVKKSMKNGSARVKGRVAAPGTPAARPGKAPRTANAPPTVAGAASAPSASGADVLYPTWLLAAPQRLAVQRNRPLYQGPLTLLAGPQRLESGWWESDATGHAAAPAALRDYFLARSAQAGLLWIYRERLPPGGAAPGWFLHGLFA